MKKVYLVAERFEFVEAVCATREIAENYIKEKCLKDDWVCSKDFTITEKDIIE